MRKKYLKPEVQSETYIEQTSLACNIIQDWEAAKHEGFYTDACAIDVTKGGNWSAPYCTVGVFDAAPQICYPSDMGIPLS